MQNELCLLQLHFTVKCKYLVILLVMKIMLQHTKKRSKVCCTFDGLVCLYEYSELTQYNVTELRIH